MEFSRSSKHLQFLSLQRHHIKQWGMMDQIWPFRWRLKLPCQQPISPKTERGITQETPKRPKTIDQRSQAKGQWRRRWSIDSPFLLHMKHQSRIHTFLFRRLSIVRHFPKAVVQTKKATLEGIFCFQMLPNKIFEFGEFVLTKKKTHLLKN